MSLTPKQEAFCVAIASGMNPSDAYRSAYDTAKMKAASIHTEAKKLLAENPQIAPRIAFLRKPVIEAAQYGLAEAMKEAAEAMAVARAKENGGAMVAAVTLRAKLAGLLVDKKEVRTGALDSLPPDEAKALLETIDTIQRARAAGAVRVDPAEGNP